MGQKSVHLEAMREINVSKQEIPDTSLNVAFLTMRVRAPNTDDWEKMSHLMEYLRGNKINLLYQVANTMGCRRGISTRRWRCNQTCAVTKEVNWRWVEDLPL